MSRRSAPSVSLDVDSDRSPSPAPSSASSAASFTFSTPDAGSRRRDGHKTTSHTRSSSLFSIVNSPATSFPPSPQGAKARLGIEPMPLLVRGGEAAVTTVALARKPISNKTVETFLPGKDHKLPDKVREFFNEHFEDYLSYVCNHRQSPPRSRWRPYIRH